MKKLTVTILLLACFVLTLYAQEKAEKNKPKATYRVGSAKVTVWENQREGQHGEFTATDFKVEKIYKKDGEWVTTNSFNLKELLQLRAVIDKAIHEEVKTKETTPEQK